MKCHFFLLRFLTFFFFILQVFAEFRTYEVKKGDTFYSIGKKFKINYLDLAKLNKEKNIKQGDKIRIPNFFLYKIKSGDNLYKISKYLEVPLEDIKKYNLKVEKLYVDKYIKIPIRFSKKQITSSQNQKKFTSQQDSTKDLEASLIKLINWKDFRWPVNGEVYEDYGEKNDIMNYGIIFKTQQGNVFSTEKGKVAATGKYRGLGRTIVIEHGEGLVSLYSGMAEIKVKTNQEVHRKISLGKAQKYFFFGVYHSGYPIDANSLLDKNLVGKK